MAFNIKQYRLTNKIAAAYEKKLKERLTPAQFRRVDVDKYQMWWKKIAVLIKDLGVTADQWMMAQFHELPRDVCLKLFKLAAPPPNALCSDRAIERFIMYVGRNNTLDVLDTEAMENRAYASSLNFADMLKKTRHIVHEDSPDWMDLVLAHMNSGDLSVVWFLRQDGDWQTKFIVRNGSALNDDVLDSIDQRIKKQILENAECRRHM